MTINVTSLYQFHKLPRALNKHLVPDLFSLGMQNKFNYSCNKCCNSIATKVRLEWIPPPP